MFISKFTAWLFRVKKFNIGCSIHGFCYKNPDTRGQFMVLRATSGDIKYQVPLDKLPAGAVISCMSHQANFQNFFECVLLSFFWAAAGVEYWVVVLLLCTQNSVNINAVKVCIIVKKFCLKWLHQWIEYSSLLSVGRTRIGQKLHCSLLSTLPG